MLVFKFLLLETASKTLNISKFTKEQEIFAKWTRDGVQHQFNKNWFDRQIRGFSETHRTSYISQNLNLYRPCQSRIIFTLCTEIPCSTCWLRRVEDERHQHFTENFETNAMKVVHDIQFDEIFFLKCIVIKFWYLNYETLVSRHSGYSFALSWSLSIVYRDNIKIALNQTNAQCLIWHYKLHQNLLSFLSKSKISEKIPSTFWRVFWCAHSHFCY